MDCSEGTVPSDLIYSPRFDDDRWQASLQLNVSPPFRPVPLKDALVRQELTRIHSLIPCLQLGGSSRTVRLGLLARRTPREKHISTDHTTPSRTDKVHLHDGTGSIKRLGPDIKPQELLDREVRPRSSVLSHSQT